MDEVTEVPWSREAEISVLGAALIDAEVVERLADLPPDAFHHEGHARVWRAMRRIHARGEAVDVTTLTDDLRQAGELEAVGGMSTLAQLLDAVPSAAAAESHADLVRDYHLRRQLLQAGRDIASKSISAPSGEGAKALDEAERALQELSRESARADYVDAARATQEMLLEVEQAYDSDRKISGLSTGFRGLDAKTDGLHSAELVVVAGRPSMGKTALALDMARHLVFEEQVPVGVFSLEMRRTSVLLRMTAAESALPVGRLRAGDIREEELQHFNEAVGRLKQAPLFVEDTSGLPLHELRRTARRMVRRDGVQVVFVDYLQLMPGPSNAERREREVAEVSRGLKGLAMELGIPVVALSQLSRAPEARSDGRPRLSDLRESGAIEQDADVVMFVYRPEVYLGDEHEGRDLRGRAEIILAKQRNGATGEVPLRFEKPLASFRDSQADRLRKGVA